MPISKVDFYSLVRKEGLFKKLSQKQVMSIDYILNYWDASGYKDLRWLAYMLATVYHETAATMLPIEEWGKGKGRKYGKKVKYSGVPYTSPDKVYYGRGYVMITWYEVYEMMGKILGVPLLQNPELALDIDVATKIMFEGMLSAHSSFGDFTGKSLEMYFNNKVNDPVNARRIINGTDKAKLIVGYHEKFLRCLKSN